MCENSIEFLEMEFPFRASGGRVLKTSKLVASQVQVNYLDKFDNRIIFGQYIWLQNCITFLSMLLTIYRKIKGKPEIADTAQGVDKRINVMRSATTQTAKLQSVKKMQVNSNPVS